MTREYGATAKLDRSVTDVDSRTRVFLHVGAPKTGTTFLQDVLWRGRDALARDGVLYPGDRPGHQFHAAQDLKGTRFHGHEDPHVPGAWEQLAARARRWDGPTVIISHEILASASADVAQRAVESLRPAEVHVVYTARDLARQIPAVWQESVKNRRVVGFPRYLHSLKHPQRPGRWGRTFWHAQDAVDVLSRWGTAVPTERIHVVTVPPPGGPTGVLWERFAGVVGLDAARYDTDVRRSNVSLGRAEIELLRRINRRLDRDIDWPTYEVVFKRGLAETTLGGRPGGEKITLPPHWQPWVAEQSERLVKGLDDAGYDIVGTLEELLPGQPGAGAGETPPSGQPYEAQLDVAADTIIQLVLDARSRRGGDSALARGRRLVRAVYRQGMRRVRRSRY